MKTLLSYQTQKAGVSLFIAFMMIGTMLGLFGVLAQPAWAMDCTVPGSHASIQAAIDDVGCDKITLSAQTYTENLVINRTLTIEGAGKTSSIIDGNGGRGVTIGTAATVTLKDLRITGGDATSAATDPRFGGGVYVTAASTLHGENLQIDSNIASTSNTSAGRGGGLAIQNGSTAILTSTMLMSNTAQPSGNASGVPQGGAIYVNTSNLSMVDSYIMNNYASNNGTDDGQGGGLFSNANTLINLQGNTWSGNKAQNSTSGDLEGNGGAIAVDFPTGATFLNLSYETFSDNVANASNDNLSGVAEDDLTRGGAIFFNTTNTAGHITATLNIVTMTNNIAKAGSGTGIGQGGGIYGQHSTIQIARSRILDNVSASSGTGNGGGIYVRESGVTTVGLGIVNTFIAGNQATGTGNGAQLHIASHELAALSFVTIADDTQNSKEAIYYNPAANASFRLLVANTIIANHEDGFATANANPLNSALSNVLFFNNNDDGSNFLDGGGNINSAANQDPLFVDAAQNDYHIGAGSAAIGKGIDDTVTKDDIDGDVRPFDTTFDIGADEATPNLTIVKTGLHVGFGGTAPYTITVNNTGAVTATNVVITDAIPSGATYGSGGTKVGDVISFTTSTIAPGNQYDAVFVLHATETITNETYRVSADNNISATGKISVVTHGPILYLPSLLKE